MNGARSLGIRHILLAVGACAAAVACGSTFDDDPATVSSALDKGAPLDPGLGTVSIDPTAGFRVKGMAGKCLTLDPKTQRIVLSTCAGIPEQKVDVVELPRRIVELRIGGQCVRPLFGFIVDGVALEAVVCTGAPTQRWMLDGDGIRLAANADGKEPGVGELSRLVVGVRDHRGADGSPLALVSVRSDESDYWEFVPDAGAPPYPTSGFVSVSTTAGLIDKINGASVGSVIEVAKGSVLDVGDYCWLPIRERVTIRGAGDRNGRRPILPPARIIHRTGVGAHYQCCRHSDLANSAGPVSACLYNPVSPDREDFAIFKMWGEGARFTNLMLEGPSTSTSPYMQVIGVQTVAHEDLNGPELRMDVDHSDLFGFPLAAVNVWGARPPIPSKQCQAPRTTDPPVVVQRNYIHANRLDGSGYGVAPGGDGRTTIFGNTFMGNRHAISGSGDSGESYYAIANLTLYSAPQEGATHNQDFDMHGTDDGPDCLIGSNSHRGGTAGDVVEVRQNTFFGDNRNNFLLRGAPCRYAIFTENVTRQTNDPWLGYQAATIDVCDDDLVVPYTETNNHYEIGDPTASTAAYDFDGDGRDDVFMATGAAWYVSFAGKTPWRFRATSTDPLKNLRFGDFDGDGRADVIRSTRSLGMTTNVTIQVRWGGEGDWVTLFALDAAISDVVVGDFDGDRRSDLLILDGASWRLVHATGATAGWSGTPITTFRASAVRVGRFDGDLRDDVIVASGGNWYSIPGAIPTSSVLLGPARDSFDHLRFVDVNGDGRTDALRVVQSWTGFSADTATDVSYGGTTAFTDSRHYVGTAPIRVPPVGRFDDKPGADVIHWRADRRFDVQSSAIAPPVLHSFDDGVTKNEMF